MPADRLSIEQVMLVLYSAYADLLGRYQGLLYVVADVAERPYERLEAEAQTWTEVHAEQVRQEAHERLTLMVRALALAEAAVNDQPPGEPPPSP